MVFINSFSTVLGFEFYRFDLLGIAYRFRWLQPKLELSIIVDDQTFTVRATGLSICGFGAARGQTQLPHSRRCHPAGHVVHRRGRGRYFSQILKSPLFSMA
jgi:hypothetical protein